MFVLDLSLANTKLYPRDKLKLNRQGRKFRWQLETTMTEGIEVIKESTRKIFIDNGYSEEKRGDGIVLVCFSLAWPFGAVLTEAIKFFDEVYLENESGTILLFSHNGAPDTPDDDE